MTLLGDRDDQSDVGRADASGLPPYLHPGPSPSAAERRGGSGPELDEARAAPVPAADAPTVPQRAARRRRLVRLSDLVRSGLLHHAAGLLAVAGVIAALALGLPMIALVTGVIAVVLPLCVAKVLHLTNAVPAGATTLPRVLLALVVVLDRHGSVVTVALCAAIAAAALLEPVLENISAVTLPLAANLPGVELRPAPVPARAVVPVNVAVAVAAAVVVAVPLPPEPLLLAALLGLAATLALTGDAAVRLMRRRRAERALPALVRAYAPLFALHWDAPENTEYQVTMWLPHLERLGVPFMVVVRNPDSFAGIARAVDVPVVLRQQHGELDAVVAPSLRGVFYVNNAARNAHFVRFTGLTHVQLNHGESDKASSYSPMFRLYDYDFVAGQAAIDRFATNGVSMPASLFRIVGRPQVAHLLVDATTSDVPTALYAPTWGGSYADSDYCSLPIGLVIVEALLRRGFRVIFRPHPYTSRYPTHQREAQRIEAALAAHANATGTQHVFGAAATSMDLFDCFDEAHLLVADVSSVVADFLYSEKPFAVVAMQGTVSDFARTFPIAEAAYVLDRKAHNVDVVLDGMTKGDPLAGSRRRAKAYFLGDLPADGYADVFVSTAREVLGLD